MPARPRCHKRHSRRSAKCPSNCPRNFFGPSRRGPSGSRRPHCLPAGHIATDKLDDSSRSHRASAQQPAFHRPECSFRRVTRGRIAAHHRHQQLADPHHPSIHRRPADRNACLPLQNHALPIQRQMIAILGHNRVDHHPVAHQALFDDPLPAAAPRSRPFRAALTGSLLALGHHHEVLEPAPRPVVRSDS